MDRPLTDELIAQYHNPVKSISTAGYRKRKRDHVKHGSVLILIGIIVLIVFVPGSSGGSGRGALWVIIIGFGLPLYGLYELIFMRSIILREIRAKLVWLNPQLKVLEPKKTVKPPLPLAKRLIIDSFIILFVVSAFTIWAYWLALH